MWVFYYIQTDRRLQIIKKKKFIQNKIFTIFFLNLYLIIFVIGCFYYFDTCIILFHILCNHHDITIIVKWAGFHKQTVLMKK